MSIREIDVVSLKQRLDARAAGTDSFFLLDVRNPSEQNIALIEGTDKLIPVNELPERLGELESHKTKEILVYCRSGGRSGNAVGVLLNAGFTNCKNVAGGILQYSDRVDSSLQKY